MTITKMDLVECARREALFVSTATGRATRTETLVMLDRIELTTPTAVSRYQTHLGDIIVGRT
jgi:hypothetical protein